MPAVEPIMHDAFNFSEAPPQSEAWMVQWWMDALARLDFELPGDILDATWHRLRRVELNFVLRGPAGGLDLDALRPKQHIPQGPIQGGVHSFLLPEMLSMDEHVMWSTSLSHPCGTAPVVEHVPP